MLPTLSQRTFSGSIFHYLTKIIVTVFSLLVTIYVVRELSIEEYGLYNFLLGIILLAQIFTSFGLVPIIQRYLPEYREKANSYFQKKLLSFTLFVRLMGGFVFILFLLLANNWIVETFNLPETFKLVLPLLSLIILFTLESQLLGDAALVSLFENKYWSFARGTYSILKFSLFFLILRLGYGVIGIVWAWLMVEGVLFALFLAKVWRTVFLLPVAKEENHPLPLRRFLGFGLPLWFHNMFYLFRDKATDIFILSYFLGQKEVGLYSFAFGVPLVIMSFSPGNILRPVSTPALVQKYVRDGNKKDLSFFFQFMNRMIFFTVVPGSLALIILSNEIIRYVFNPAYLKISALFMLATCFLMIIQFAYAYTSILYALEKSKIMFVASWTALYNLVMDLILIPRLGVLGAILATGSAGLMLLPYYHFALRKEEGIELRYPWKSFAKFTLNNVPLCFSLFFSRGFVHNLASLVGILLIGLVVYLSVSYLNKGFEEEDRKILNNAIGKNIFLF